MTKREYFFVALIAFLFITSGSGVFSTLHFRGDNERLEAENEALAEASAMLLKENEMLSERIAERDTFIKTTTLAYDTFKSNLAVISAEIAADFPSRARIHTAAIDSQVVYITEFISKADSIGR